MMSNYVIFLLCFGCVDVVCYFGYILSYRAAFITSACKEYKPALKELDICSQFPTSGNRTLQSLRNGFCKSECIQGLHYNNKNFLHRIHFLLSYTFSKSLVLTWPDTNHKLS